MHAPSAPPTFWFEDAMGQIYSLLFINSPLLHSVKAPLLLKYIKLCMSSWLPRVCTMFGPLQLQNPHHWTLLRNWSSLWSFKLLACMTFHGQVAPNSHCCYKPHFQPQLISDSFIALTLLCLNYSLKILADVCFVKCMWTRYEWRRIFQKHLSDLDIEI